MYCVYMLYQTNFKFRCSNLPSFSRGILIQILRMKTDSPLYFGNGWSVGIDKVLLGSNILSVDFDRVQGVGQVLRHALTAVETLKSALLVFDKFAVLLLFGV